MYITFGLIICVALNEIRSCNSLPIEMIKYYIKIHSEFLGHFLESNLGCNSLEKKTCKLTM